MSNIAINPTFASNSLETLPTIFFIVEWILLPHRPIAFYKMV